MGMLSHEQIIREVISRSSRPRSLTAVQNQMRAQVDGDLDHLTLEELVVEAEVALEILSGIV